MENNNVNLCVEGWIIGISYISERKDNTAFHIAKSRRNTNSVQIRRQITKIERLAETLKKYLEERKRKDSKVVSIFIYSKQRKTKTQLYHFDFKRDLKL